MQKLTYIVFALLILLVASCGNKDQKPADYSDKLNTQQMILNHEDTTEVRDLVTSYLELLKNKKLDEAVSMLNYLNDSNEVDVLPAKLAKDITSTLSYFTGMDYSIDYMIFNTENDCMVKYFINMPESNDGHLMPQVGFVLRPVREKGKWYLTVADKQTDTVESEIQN